MWTKSFVSLIGLTVVLIPYIVWLRVKLREKREIHASRVKAIKQRVEEFITLGRRANLRGDTESWNGYLLQAQGQLDLLRSLGGKNTIAWVEDKAHEVQTCQKANHSDSTKSSHPAVLASDSSERIVASRLQLITPLSEEDLLDDGHWLTIDRTQRSQQALDFEQ